MMPSVGLKRGALDVFSDLLNPSRETLLGSDYQYEND
jgi:hypothetical protein